MAITVPNESAYVNRKINKPLDWWMCDIDFIIEMHFTNMKIGRQSQCIFPEEQANLWMLTLIHKNNSKQNESKQFGRSG